MILHLTEQENTYKNSCSWVKIYFFTFLAKVTTKTKLLTQIILLITYKDNALKTGKDVDFLAVGMGPLIAS